MRFKYIILLVLLLPIKVLANNIIEFDCQENICDVYGNIEEEIQAIDFKYFLPSYIETNEFILEEGDIGIGEENWVTTMFKDNVKGHFKIGTLKYTGTKILNSNDIQIKEITIIDKNNEEKIINNSNVNKKEIGNELIIISIICGIIIIGIGIYFIIIKKRGVSHK